MGEHPPHFDVVYGEHGISIDYHFCREWDQDGGCYGTNPNHGFSFEEAREMVASWHEERAREARKTTLTEWEKSHFLG